VRSKHSISEISKYEISVGEKLSVGYGGMAA